MLKRPARRSVRCHALEGPCRGRNRPQVHMLLVLLVGIASVSSCATTRSQPRGALAERIRVLEYFRKLPIGTRVSTITAGLGPDELYDRTAPSGTDPVWRFVYRKGDLLVWFKADKIGPIESLREEDLPLDDFAYLGEYGADLKRHVMMRACYGEDVFGTGKRSGD